VNCGGVACEIEPCIHDQGCDPVSLYYQALSLSAGRKKPQPGLMMKW